jgi:hypothetical protein
MIALKATQAFLPVLFFENRLRNQEEAVAR